MRSSSALISAIAASRCSGSSASALRSSVSRFARSPVSGVRSSWPASAAKRRVAPTAPLDAAEHLVERRARAERTSAGPSSSGSGRARSSVPLIALRALAQAAERPHRERREAPTPRRR